MALISTLTDNFDDNTLNASLWTSFGSGTATASETNNRLEIALTPTSGANSYAGYYTNSTYDLTNSSITVDVQQVLTPGFTDTTLELNKSANEYILMYVASGDLKMMTRTGPSSSSYRSITYNSTNHKWWRIRHTGSDILWETSPDNVTWTTRRTRSAPFAITSLVVHLYAGSFSASSVSGTAIFDSLNPSPGIATSSVSYPFTASTTLSETAVYDSSVAYPFIGAGSYLTAYQPLTQKDYEVRISSHDGDHISTLTNITSEFGYSQGINQNATEMTISVARSPDNKARMLSALKDTSSANITDTNGDIIYVPTETPNSVGPGTDIDLNHNVDVYAFYGGFEQLLDTSGESITDTNGDAILTEYGSPNGLRVYSGYIVDYELLYGGTTGVNFTVVPHATEQSHYIFKDGTNTTVAYLNTDPVEMARDAMDNYIAQGGVITYDSESMPLSGESSDYPFKLQTTREAIDKTVELLPVGWYHYVHPGENKQYLLEKGSVADHTFYYQQHISELKLRKSLTQLKNKVYFIGGETAGVPLYTYEEDATSITDYRPGLERLADSRVTDPSSAEALSLKELNTYKIPRYRTTVRISDKMYDIETIRLGQMVGFKNFDTFVDNLVLQIVNVDKRKHHITFDLDMIVPSDTKRLIELKKQLMSQEVANIATVPS